MQNNAGLEVKPVEDKKKNRVVTFFKSNGEESIFGKACANVPKPHGKPGIPLAKRQASKWLMKKGAAWKFGR